jgi:hypothetical protein
VTAYEITDETVDSQTETLDDVAGVGMATGRRSSINAADDSGDKSFYYPLYHPHICIEIYLCV